MVPIYYFHHNPDYWKDPDKFDPGRYANYNNDIHGFLLLSHKL